MFTEALNASFVYDASLCSWRTCRASAVVKQYAVLFRAPSTDCRARLTGDQASRLCWVVKRASSPTSTTRHLRTELSRRATVQGMESKVQEKGVYRHESVFLFSFFTVTI